MAGFLYTVGLDASKFKSGVADVATGIGNMVAGISPAVSGLGALTAGLGAAALAGASLYAAFKFTQKGIAEAANRETLRTAFVPLLGSVAAARARMAELAEFAEKTPFDLPEVAKASRALETLTNGAMSTGEGLDLVGDVASSTNTGYEGLAVTIGRLYQGWQSGRPVGIVAQRLLELGALSAEARTEIEELQAAGKKGNEVWEVAARDLRRFSGGMEAQSATWNGLMANLGESWDSVIAAFGEPIMDSLKPFLTEADNLVEVLLPKAAAVGKAIGRGISFLTEAFRKGVAWDLAEIGLKIAFGESVNFLWASLNGAFRAAGQALSEYIKTSIMWFDILTDARFWQGAATALGSAMIGVVSGVASAFYQALSWVIDKLIKPVADFLGMGDFVQDVQSGLGELTGFLDNLSDSAFQVAGDELAGLWDAYGDRYLTRVAETFQNITAAYQEGMANAGDLIDTSGWYEDMANACYPLFEALYADAAARR